MLMTNEEINSRLNSSDNLINKLKSLINGDHHKSSIIDVTPTTPTVNSPSNKDEASEIPAVSELIENAQDKIKIALAQTKALDVLNNTLDELSLRVVEAEGPKDLSRIASDMSKIVTGIRTAENKKDVPTSQVIIYKPVMALESHYQTVVVNE